MDEWGRFGLHRELFEAQQQRYCTDAQASWVERTGSIAPGHDCLLFHGSNSFHLVHASYDGGALRVIDRLKERVFLADGLDSKYRLDEDAMERAIQCLRLFVSGSRHSRA